MKKINNFLSELKLEIHDDIFLIYHGELNLFGYGDSYGEAFIDFAATVFEYWQALKTEKTNLGKIPSRDLEILDQIFLSGGK